MPVEMRTQLQRSRNAHRARNWGAEGQNQASQQQRMACLGRVGWGASDAVPFKVVNGELSVSTTRAFEHDFGHRISCRSSVVFRCTGTAGELGAAAHRQVRTVVCCAQHDGCRSPASEQQQPQQDCRSAQLLRFVSHVPTAGTTAEKAVAAISRHAKIFFAAT
jgi:hypothetical protein